MTHPEELLAGFVDDTLSPKERAEVDAHLGTCQICREEADLAARAAGVVRQLPEEPVPVGVTDSVAAEVRRRTAGRRATPRRARVRWAAGLAAAAALVAVVALGLPRLGGGGGATRATGGGGGEAASSRAAAPGVAEAALAQIPLEIRAGVDYSDPAKLAALADEAASHPTSADTSPTARTVTPADAESAGACVASGAGEGLSGNDLLVRLIEAKFDGAPAYLGVYLESPGSGKPPEKVVIWIVSKRSCSVLSLSTKRI